MEGTILRGEFIPPTISVISGKSLNDALMLCGMHRGYRVVVVCESMDRVNEVAYIITSEYPWVEELPCGSMGVRYFALKNSSIVMVIERGGDAILPSYNMMLHEWDDTYGSQEFHDYDSVSVFGIKIRRYNYSKRIDLNREFSMSDAELSQFINDIL